MKIIDVVYSPVCEATGAMIEKLKSWLEGTDVQINILPYHHLTSDKKVRKDAKTALLTYTTVIEK